MAPAPPFLHPKPGAKVQVIGAGLPRTGTNSFCAAIDILLDGPSYHTGVQYCGTGATDESHILTMIDLCTTYPYKTLEQKSAAYAKLESELDGYVSTNDPPLSLLVPELMHLYPNALVIVTTREKEPWGRSMVRVVKSSQPRLAGFIFFWLPSLRHLPTLADGLTRIFHECFGITTTDMETAYQLYDKHAQWIEQVVPKEKLVYFNVKEGWGPLCAALGKDVPDVPFPRVNDGDDFDEHFRKLAEKGLWRWVIIFAGVVVPVAAAAYWLVGR